MKKILGLGILLTATATLSACGGIPKCTDYLDECNRGGAYTEERTAQADKKVVIAPAPAPAPVIVAPAPALMPAPAPVVVDDTPVMMSAEPQFTTISK